MTAVESTDSSSSASSPSEATPLLQPRAPQGRTPLPIGQLTILALVRLCEPIAFTVIFPFVNEMMEFLQVTDKTSEIGFYSGLVDSTFAFGQLMTAFHWGRLSDRIGRRSVLFIGMSGAATSIFLFGLSNSLAWAVLSRSIAGTMSSNVAIIQSIMGEITDKTNEALALPLISVTWSIGTIIGPLIGGTFSRPATRYPDVFGSYPLLHQFPYFLPCAIAAAIVVASMAVGYLFLEETLPSKRRSRTGSSMMPAAKASTISNSSRTQYSAMEILSRPAIQRIFASSFVLNVLTTAFDVVFILMSYTPIHLGGLSRTPAQIGYALAGGGFFSLAVLPFGIPYLQHRFGTAPLYRVLMMFWPMCYVFLPILNVVARIYADEEGELQGQGPLVVWIGVGILTIAFRIACMCFSLNILLVKEAAPSREALGSTYGLSTTVSCVARALSPAFVSSLFALSIENRLLGGQLVWLIMTALGIVGVMVSSRLRDGSNEETQTAGA